MMSAASSSPPLYIRMHDNDNVAIVANDGGLKAGAVFPCGLILNHAVPQGHKISLRDMEQGAPIIRYNVTIAYALVPIAKGSWVTESLMQLPPARSLTDLPMSTRIPPPLAPRRP